MRRNTCRKCKTGEYRHEHAHGARDRYTHEHTHDDDTDCIADVDDAKRSSVPGCGPPSGVTLVCPTSGVRFTPNDACQENELRARGWSEGKLPNRPAEGDVPGRLPGDIDPKSAAKGAGVGIGIGVLLLGL